MRKLILIGLIVFVVGYVGIYTKFDIFPSDIYDADFDYSVFTKPTKTDQDVGMDGFRIPDPVGEYWTTKKLQVSEYAVVNYDLYLGISVDGEEHFYATQSNCGYTINSLSIETNTIREISDCHNFNFGSGVMNWRNAELYTLITNAKLVYSDEEQRIGFGKDPGKSPQKELTIVDLQTGEKKGVDIAVETEKRERGTSFSILHLSPDFQYFAIYFISDFKRCYTSLNQPEKCDYRLNLLVGKVDDGIPRFIFRGGQIDFSGQNPLNIGWTANNDLLFTYKGTNYLSVNTQNLRAQ